jgi:hypothetical protein
MGEVRRLGKEKPSCTSMEAGDEVLYVRPDPEQNKPILHVKNT